MVKEHPSLQKTKEWDELCVETVSLDTEFSTGRQTSSFDQDTSGHLAAVLSKVNASDFAEA